MSTPTREQIQARADSTQAAYLVSLADLAEVAERLRDDSAPLSLLTSAVEGTQRRAGAVGVLARAARLPDSAAVVQHATGILARGADDSWSGRSNDAARSQFDGARDACAWLLGLS